MKALPKKLLPLTLFAIAVTSLFSVQPAQGFTMTLQQVGSNVVANGSGAINLTGLTLDDLFSPVAGVVGSSGIINMGQSAVNVPGYFGFTGPSNFGGGGLFSPNTSSGDFVGINNSPLGDIFVPQGYVSDTALSDSMTFNSATFASLGLTPGTYTWSWGTGLRNQNFTLIIGGAGVPDGGSTVFLLGFGLLGLAALRRKLKLLKPIS
jgi:protein with PEP-CTERM/exosortase system signal